MVDTLTVVNLNRQDGTDITSQTDNQVFRRVTDLVNGIQIIVFQMDFVHFVQRHHRDLFTVSQRDIENAVQCGIDFLFPHFRANVFARDGRRLVGYSIPNRKVRHFIPIEVFHPLRGETVFREFLRTVVRNEIFRMQTGQRIRAHQKRHVGVVLNVVDINQTFVHDDLGCAEEYGDIRQTGTNGNPVVRFR